MAPKFSRRGFLLSTSMVGATALISTSGMAAGKQIIDLLNPNSPLMMPANFEPSVWFTMESNGRTTIHIFKAEIGQHVGTALSQIVAEQLCLDWENVDIDYPVMDSQTFGKYQGQLTGGSYSIHEMFDKLSRASAVARQVLLEAGADLMGSEFEDCRVADSKVIDDIFDQEITFSDILSETTIDYEILEDDLESAQLIAREDFKIIGKSIPALDIPEKLNGNARFGIDAYVPNMQYAKIIVPPTRLGATISSIDDNAAQNIDGYITTIPVSFPDEAKQGGFITDIPVVIAKNYPAALRAAKVVNVEWITNANKDVSSETLMDGAKALIDTKSEGIKYFTVGRLDDLDHSSLLNVEADYQTSMVAHAPLEPANALARYVGGELHVYSSHQGGPLIPMYLSMYTGVPAEKIIFHPHLIGGGFGKKFEFEAIILASIAALKTNQPVKLIFTREDDLAFAHPRTSTYQRLSAFVDNKNQIKGLNHEIAAGWIVFDKFGLIKPVVNGQAQETDERLQLFSLTGSDHWYDIENTEVIAYRHKQLEDAVPVRAVRSVANNYTVFSLESFVDEIAHAVGADPLNLRLSMLHGKGVNAGGDDSNLYPVGMKPFLNVSPLQRSASINGGKRLANVLKLASGLANYGASVLPENTAHGIAIAGAEERTNPSFSACIAEVHVDPGSAAVTVKKLTVAIDLGLIVNPDGAKAQIEGSILWGLSNCLHEKLTIANGAVVETNFDKYKWQNIMNIPELNIHIVENGSYPSGAGEPATSIIAPAILNAVFNASGARLRSLPLNRNELLQKI